MSNGKNITNISRKADRTELLSASRKKKRKKNSHAGNRTPATAVRAPDPNH